MKSAFLLCLIVAILAGDVYAQQPVKYPVISYLDIPVDSMGNLPQNPYIIKLRSNTRELIAIGTQHTYDTTSQVFTKIEDNFYSLNPGVIINEGGNLSQKYRSRNVAITTNAELGLEKYLADKACIKTVNGDMPDKMEFEELCKRFPRKEVLVYMASERFIFSYKFGQFKGDLPKLYYSNFIKGYMLKAGINLSVKEQTFAYYRNAYKKCFHEAFSIDRISQLNFTPFGRYHHFNTITRASKEIRDQYLLYKLEEQLQLYHKILLVFGGWHILSIEPALKAIMARQP